MTVTEENAEPIAPPEEPAERAPSSEKWVFVFLAALIAFNLFIFFGSQEKGGRTSGNTPPPPPPPAGGGPGQGDSSPVPPPARPSPGQVPAADPASPSPGPPPSPGEEGDPGPPASPPPPPPPPPNGAGGPPPGVSGPELILGVAALKGNAEAGLTSQQEAALVRILARMRAPQLGQQKAADAALSYLNPKQVEWVRINRGPAIVEEDGDVEPGMDPITSAAFRVLEKKALSAKGQAQTYTHKVADLHFHDLLNGVLKLEAAGGQLALTPDQAKAIAAQVEEGNRSRKQESDLFEEMAKQLDKKQLAYLEAHPELVKMDVNALILRYAEMTLEK